MTSLPRAASVALWLNAWLRDDATPDDVLQAFGSDLHHVFVALDSSSPLGTAEALGVIRRLTPTVTLALTMPGDPAGLAGPPAFNITAMETGQALLLPAAQMGIVPVPVGGAIEWRCYRAHAAPAIDPRESRHRLRHTLREVTEELVRLDIRSWSSEIPDLLMNRHDPITAPAGIHDQDLATLNSAALCLAIVGAAAEVEPGALNAAERSHVESGMRRLDAAARHALVAVCSGGVTSDNLASP